jgi:formylglycine-generating enzyme required for sulfatase activity
MDTLRFSLPEMIGLPAGSFTMGSPANEPGRLGVESPQHRVSIAAPFAVAKFAVTVEEFATFITCGDYQSCTTGQTWDGIAWSESGGFFFDPGFTQACDHPAVCVSWRDACAYTAWLSEMTGEVYRLLTEAEWEYAARAGTATPYWWGSSASQEHANYGRRAKDWRTVPVASFEPNPWGLYQTQGNVWEWVEDCWADNYTAASSCGAAHACSLGGELRVLRGGSWLNGPNGIRSARRHAARPDFRRSDVGFRIAKTL